MVLRPPRPPPAHVPALRRPQLPPGRLAHHASAAAVLDSSSRARFDQWLRDFELQASVNAQGEGGNGSAGGDGGDADEGYAAWIAELKECLLQAGVHNRPAALMGDAGLLSEATLRDVGALLRFFRNGVEHGPGYPAGSVTGPVALAAHMSHEGTALRLLPDAAWPAGHAQ